jgi:hypothetical protein
MTTFGAFQPEIPIVKLVISGIPFSGIIEIFPELGSTLVLKVFALITKEWLKFMFITVTVMEYISFTRNPPFLIVAIVFDSDIIGDD